MKVQTDNLRRSAIVALLVILMMMPACDSLMDNTTGDPHPPYIRNLTITPTVILVGGSIQFCFEYYDNGADIENVHSRDKQSGRIGHGVPPEGVDEETWEPFPGISGISCWNQEDLTSHQSGPHTLMVWVEDSEGSISNILEAVYHVVL